MSPYRPDYIFTLTISSKGVSCSLPVSLAFIVCELFPWLQRSFRAQLRDLLIHTSVTIPGWLDRPLRRFHRQFGVCGSSETSPSIKENANYHYW